MKLSIYADNNINIENFVIFSSFYLIQLYIFILKNGDFKINLNTDNIIRIVIISNIPI